MTEGFILEKIRLLRVSKGYSQTDIATIIGVVQNTYSRWESGHSEISESNLQKIADALKVPLYEITGKIPKNRTVELTITITADDDEVIAKIVDGLRAGEVRIK